VFNWLSEQVSGSPISYVIVALAAGGDVLFPLIPSETMVLTASVLASHGDLSIWLIMLVTAGGAMIGDNVSWLLGARVGEPLARRLFRGDRAQQRLRSAETAIDRHGPVVIIVGRYIPGGRTASTFAAGLLEMRWRRFVVFDVIAAVLWSVCVSLLGYLGGTAFRDSVWKPLLALLGLAAVIAGLTEVWRRAQRRRGRDLFGDPLTKTDAE
jgi:membrane-associated protein